MVVVFEVGFEDSPQAGVIQNVARSEPLGCQATALRPRTSLRNFHPDPGASTAGRCPTERLPAIDERPTRTLETP